MKNKKIGLVLAGGGGKGAYQLGVWKFFKEIGLDEHIEVISGTSVGALNAILFSLENYENCEKIWKGKIKEKILLKNENLQSIIDQITMLLSSEISKNKPSELLNNLKSEISINKPFEFFNNLYSRDILLIRMLLLSEISINKCIELFNNLKKDGLYSRDGLLDIINSIDISQLRKCKKTIYATCTEVPSGKAISFKLNNRNTNDMKKILLATSAIPGVFKIEQIDGKEYYDGGLKDNVPETPLIMEGCTHNIIVYLENDVNDVSNNERIVIKPSQYLGNIISGTLNFEKDKISELINLGYKDASKNYHSVLEKIM
jgi:NTE family protein